MTGGARAIDEQRVLAGYDGSPDAANAIEIDARLLPAHRAQVVHLWAPPFADPKLRRRVIRDEPRRADNAAGTRGCGRGPARRGRRRLARKGRGLGGGAARPPQLRG